MTTSGMMDLTDRFLRTDLDSYQGDAPTDAQKVAVLNWAQRTVSKKVKHFDAKLVLTLQTDVDTYDLRACCSKRVVQAYRVIINANQLLDASGRDFGMWALTELEQARPQWRTEPSGRPTRAVQYGQKLILNPAPTAAIVSDGSNYVAGTCLAADLSEASPNGTSELPEETHEPICYLAAFRHALPSVTEDFAWARLREYMGQGMDEIEQLARENENLLMSWGSTPANDVDLLWI